MGGWSYNFHDHWLGLFALRKSQASPSKASLSAYCFLSLVSPGKISFHSVMASGSLFVTCKGVGESGKMQDKDLLFPFLIESVKWTISRDEKGWRTGWQRICFYLFMSLGSVSLLSKFRYFKIMYLCSWFIETSAGIVSTTGASYTKKVYMLGFLFLSSFRILAS